MAMSSGLLVGLNSPSWRLRRIPKSETKEIFCPCELGIGFLEQRFLAAECGGIGVGDIVGDDVHLAPQDQLAG